MQAMTSLVPVVFIFSEAKKVSFTTSYATFQFHPFLRRPIPLSPSQTAGFVTCCRLLAYCRQWRQVHPLRPRFCAMFRVSGN